MRLTHDEVVTRIEKIHGGKITVIGPYIQHSQPIAVRCECGYQWAPRANNLLNGKGCRKCLFKRLTILNRLTHDEVVARVAEIFRGRITVIGRYIRRCDPLLVRCECGHEWGIVASYLLNGQGCTKCKGRKLAELKRLTHDEVVSRITAKSGGKITVIGQYKNTHSKLEVRCECGHQWAPTADSLFLNGGCPNCVEYGFRRNKPAIAYYLRIATPAGPLYKIGITNGTVARRFRMDMGKITILKIWNFPNGFDAYTFEQKVLRENAFDQYYGPEILSRAGNDELFVCDVLGLDTGGPQLNLEIAA
jgi:hypothetical protein